MPKLKVLFLCTGNSCRSQMAEGFLKSFDKELYVRSAGTAPAKQINPKAIKVMKEIKIDISKGKPENVSKYIKEEWDYVITVCGHANETCPVFSGKVKHRLHMGFDDPDAAKGSEKQIMAEFKRIRNEIKIGFREFYEGLKYKELQLS